MRIALSDLAYFRIRVKSVLGFVHAAIALPAHLIMLTPPPILDLPGVFHTAWQKERTVDRVLAPYRQSRDWLSAPDHEFVPGF
jgi:hypothetical protein